MPFLRIFCPVEHKSFATSVETSIEHKASLPNMIKFSIARTATRFTAGRLMKHFSLIQNVRPLITRLPIRLRQQVPT